MTGSRLFLPFLVGLLCLILGSILGFAIGTTDPWPFISAILGGLATFAAFLLLAIIDSQRHDPHRRQELEPDH